MFKKTLPTKEKSPMFFGMLLFVGIVLGVMIAGMTLLFSLSPSTPLPSQDITLQTPPSDVSVPALSDSLVDYIKKHGEDIKVGYANVCSDPETLPNQNTSYPNVWQNNAVSVTQGITSDVLINRTRQQLLQNLLDGTLLTDFTVEEACALEGNTVTEALCLTKSQLQAILSELSAEQRASAQKLLNTICTFDGRDAGNAPDYACNAYVTLDATCPGNNICKSKDQGDACGVDNQSIGQNVNIDQEELQKMIENFKKTVNDMLENSEIEIILTPYETKEKIQDILENIATDFTLLYLDPNPFEDFIYNKQTPTRLQCAEDTDPDNDIFESGETYDPNGNLIFRDICVKYYGVTAVSQASCSSPDRRPTMGPLDACPSGCKDGTCARPTYCVLDNECAQGQVCLNGLCQERRGSVEVNPQGNTCTSPADCPAGLTCLKPQGALVGICAIQ